MSIEEAKEEFVIRPVSLQFSRGLVFFWMVLMEVKELLLLPKPKACWKAGSECVLAAENVIINYINAFGHVI